MFYDTLPTIYPAFGVAAPPTELKVSDGAFGQEYAFPYVSVFSIDYATSFDTKKLIVLVSDVLTSQDYLTNRQFVVIDNLSPQEIVMDRTFSSIEQAFAQEVKAYSPSRFTLLSDIATWFEKAGIWYKSFDYGNAFDTLTELSLMIFDSATAVDSLVFVGKLIYGIIDYASGIELLKLTKPVFDNASSLERSSMIKSVLDYSTSIELVSYRHVELAESATSSEIIGLLERTLSDRALFLDAPRVFVEDGVLKIIAFCFDENGFVNVVFDELIDHESIIEAKVSPRTMFSKESTLGLVVERYENVHPDSQHGSRIDADGQSERFVYDYISDQITFKNVLMDAIAEAKQWYILKIAQAVSKTVFEVFDESRNLLDSSELGHGHGDNLHPMFGESNNTEVNDIAESWYAWILKRRFLHPEPTVEFGIEQIAEG